MVGRVGRVCWPCWTFQDSRVFAAAVAVLSVMLAVLSLEECFFFFSSDIDSERGSNYHYVYIYTYVCI